DVGRPGRRDHRRRGHLSHRRQGQALGALRFGLLGHVARALRRHDGARGLGRRSVAPVRPAGAGALARARAPARRDGLGMSAVLGYDERELCAARRRGDEAAFVALVERYHAPLRRLALSYVRSPAVADEVVQETWLGVIKGIQTFEGRASLKTWIYRILTNTAQTRGLREARSV